MLISGKFYSLIMVILFIFVSCNREKQKDNYYNLSAYIVKDTLFDKEHKISQIIYVNKYDREWNFIKFYYLSGNIQSKFYTHNGNANGPFILYYPEKKGCIYAKGYFKNKHLSGKVIYFYENGRINNIKYFKLGKNIGTWKTFDSSGHLMDSTVYP